MKIALAILIIICGCSAGNIYANKLKKRHDFLSNLIVLLENFSQLIRYKNMSVTELIKWAKDSGEYKNLTFLYNINLTEESFERQWLEACENTELKNFLKPSDIEEIKAIGRGLGKSDKEGQSGHIKLHCKMLEQKLNEAKEDEMIKGRLYRKVGMLAGIAGAIMLI